MYTSQSKKNQEKMKESKLINTILKINEKGPERQKDFGFLKNKKEKHYVNIME